MIRRELPLTTDASPARPVANFRRGFSFVLAAAAADLVLELDNAFHRWLCSVFFLFREVFVFVFSCSDWLSASCFGLDCDGPDKAQQFSSDGGHGFPLILACHGQGHIALMQTVLRLPRDFDDLSRNPLLSLTQLSPTLGQCR